MGNVFSQSFFIPPPTLTEANLPDQTGRVHIVTGGYSGVGFELCQILYRRNAKVYIAGRNSEKASSAIRDIRAANPSAEGSLEYMQLDLADLTSIKPAVDAFTAKESRLDVLTNNAGVMIPPKGSKTAQGIELQLGTNCLGPFLLTQLLLPLLKRTAASLPPTEAGAVRVTWAASLAIELTAPEHGADFSSSADDKESTLIIPESIETAYGMSKAGNAFLAAETARRYGGKQGGIISVAWNPGNLRSQLQRHAPWLYKSVNWILLNPPIYGAYTELYAGWSPDITESQNGSYVVPWGRIGAPRPGIAAGVQSDGSKPATAQRFWDYCEKETSAYA